MPAARSARSCSTPWRPAPTATPTCPRSDGEDLDRSLRPAVTLVSAWVSEVARKERIDTSLLATRADLVALLRGDADARLRSGWRAELLGDDIVRLVDGAPAWPSTAGAACA